MDPLSNGPLEHCGILPVLDFWTELLPRNSGASRSIAGRFHSRRKSGPFTARLITDEMLLLGHLVPFVLL